MKRIRHSESYEQRRRVAYPVAGEQFDALVQLAQALKDQGITLPEKTEQWLSDCQRVKQRFKKN